MTMELEINVKYPRGLGFWKFNSSLLEDDEYTEKLMFKIPHFINKYQDLEDHGLLWELIKMEIRAFTINYSKKRKKIMKKILYRKSQDWEIWFKIARHQKPSRNILKLRTNWRRFPTTGKQAHVCAPKPVDMSLADEAQNIFLILRDEITKINALLDLYGSSITDPKEILKEQKRFYQFLYSSQNPQVNDPKFEVFFDNDKVEKLNDEQRYNCEGLLMENECFNALKCFQKNKSPGNDGFTAKFYSFFWNQLGKTMVNSFNYGFHKYGGRELPLQIFKFLGISFVIFFVILIYFSFFF